MDQIDNKDGSEFDCKGGCRRRTANLSGTCTDCRREGCGRIVMGQSGDCVCPSPEHHEHLVAQSRLRFDKAQGRLIPPLRVEHPFGLDVPVYAPEHLEPRIAAVVKGFDAERVHKVMTMLDWRWGGSDMPVGGVPTIEQIREKAADLLSRTLTDFAAGKIGAGGGWGTGGLKTTISERGELAVTFELCDAFEQIQWQDEADNPLPAGYLCVGDPRTWSKP